MSFEAFGQCSPDVTPPTITCPSDIIVGCPQEVPSLTPTTSDFCGAITLQTYTLTGATTANSPATGINDASSEDFLAGTTTITYYIEDASGNSSSCSFDVTVNDYTDPIIVCKDDIVTVNDPGACTAVVNMYAIGVYPSAFDSCSGLFIVPTGIPPGGAFPVGTTTVTWTVTDAAGNSTFCTQDVTVTDEEDPTINCPSDIVASTDPGLCNANVTIPFAVPDDNCSVVSISNDYNAGGADASGNYPIGTTTVTYTATDSAGRTTTCSFDVTVVNSQDPIITLNGANPQIFEACSTYTELGATAIDNCFGDISSSLVIDTSAVDMDAVGSYPVTYTVTNANGGQTQVIRTITIVDTTAPSLTFVGPNPLTVADCSTYTELGATAIDPCFGDISSSVVIDNSAVDTSTIGSYTVTYNVTDASGNAATQIIRTVNVVDVSGPIITLVGDDPQVIEACDTYTDLGATAIDPCFGTDYTADIINDSSTLDTNTPGSYTVTYNVMDAEGNPGLEVIRNITVVDTTGPIITLLGDDPQIIEACSPYTELGATAIDPCIGTDYTSDIVIDASSVDTSTVGSYNVTYNVMDALGNSAIEVIRTVTVVDTTSPSITCPVDIVANNDAGQCSAVVTYSVTANDNCSGETITQTDATGLTSGDAFPIGTTVLEYSVTDPYGNSDTCSFSVTVNDAEVPNVVCQAASLQLDPVTGLATLLPSDVDNGTTDNCSFTLSLSQDTFDCSHIGNNTVTLTATDANGNVSSCDASVTITDLAENASVSIATPITTICQNQEITVTATPVDGGTSPSYQWQINGIDVPGEVADTFTSSTFNDGDVVTVIMTSNISVCAVPVTSNTITITVNDFNAPADAGADVTNTVCVDTTITLSGSAVNGVGAVGTWSVTSGQTSGFSFSDVNSPTSDFTGDIGETYTLTWSVDNPDPCVDTSDSLTVTMIGCNALDFDGVDDNITFRDNYNLGSAFTIEVWMKSDTQNSDIQTIFSKREATNLVDGYDLRLVNNVVSFHWNNGQSVSSGAIQITNDRWYHIAVTYDGANYKLYIDGVFINSTSDTNEPIDNTVDCIAGAMDQTLNAPFLPENYFDGGLDELRIWDVALTEDQIRKMMNQEIEDNSGIVRGSVVPLDLTGLNWNDLNGYYQMNQNTDLSGGNLVSNSLSGINGVLRYMTTLQPETAPLPYQSVGDGDWTNNNTWLYGNSQAIPNSMGIDGSTVVDWNIVRTSHNISSGNNNLTVLGLEVNANTLRIENLDPTDGQSLRVTDYLMIDGASTVLKLVGESQLLQDVGSVVNYTGTGALHRDQQGTNNVYNYNYWGSPVSTDGLSYTVGGSLYDGSQPVQWTTGYDGIGSTTPVTMSSRWLYIYENYPVNSYADWVRINQTSSVAVPLGFLMKGSGTADPEQNYTFVGQPNNGTYLSPISPDYEALVSNPYPSAIDAHAFINDNSASTLGTLYFWEHYVSNATHVTVEYQGGFAAYNLTGGNAAISPPEISGLGVPSKIPERYIPIAQGFNVRGNGTGGDVVFNNDQRVFVKEAVTGGLDNGSVFMRSQNQAENRPEDQPIQRVRIDFTTPEGALRPIMIGFVPNDLATDGVDYGYDALNTEDLPNDMSWMIEDLPYIIQGVGEFDISKRYPLGIFLEDTGTFEISLRGLENFEEDITVYVYDALLETFTPINNSNYSNTLNSGDYLDRFYIAFTPDNILSTGDNDMDTLVVNYLNDNEEIYINTPYSYLLEDVLLFNMLGQQVMVWDVSDMDQTTALRIPVKNLAEGNYIIKVVGTDGAISKKVVVSKD
ncbi:immunoglobulin-like domain-containing protein [Hanstruepera neustonica]|uniref:immunoglobulin-like domain-containing protein n=1 Tax=Hanstruepera neustonica TaxID=1445657 RepID=UPI000F4DA269|nr:immunoglobulin-like domain-containing protein [Hanstruepera neustonica]